MGVCRHPEGRKSSKPGYSSDPACPSFEPAVSPGNDGDGELYWCHDCGQAFHVGESPLHKGHRVYPRVLALPDEFEHTLAAD